MWALLNPRMWLFAGAALLLALSHTMAYKTGKTAVTAKWQAADLQRMAQAADAERENRATESRRSTNVIDAQNAQAKRTQTLALAAASARTESDGLRSDLAAARSELPSRTTDASTDYANAADQLLGAMEAGAARLSQRGADIAAKADGHASDYQTLADGWAK